MAVTRDQVAKLYVANFNRAPDAAGLDYWISDGTSATTTLTDLNELAAAMQAGAEASTGVASMTDSAYVISLYSSMFGRAVLVDSADVTYWTTQITEGNVTRANMIQTLILGAEASTGSATDAAVLANKAEVGIYYADTLGLDGTNFSLATVTDDDATVTAAKASADTYVPVSLSLTTGADTLTGSAGNDTFTADILTLGATDSVVDSSTTDADVMNMTINASVAATTTITNVETLNITSLGGNTVDMTKITGVNALNTTGSTGTVTVTNAANAGMDLGFAGSSTNNINATYTADALSSTADKLNVNLNTATGVTATVNAGFESAEIAVTGTSSLTDLNAPGVTALTISGTGALTIADNALDGFTAVTVTDTGAISTGAMTGVKTFVATANTGGIVDADIALTTTGFSDTNTIVGDTAGLSFLTGAGNDNVSITDAATSNSSTIKLGAGDDKLKLLNTGTVATYIFGEAGDDTILIADSTTAITANDLIDGGAGTDTLVVDEASANTFVLRGIENVILTNSAVAANTINSSDTALNIIAEVGDGAGGDTAVNLATLTAGSTVTTRAATATYGTAAIAGDQAAAVTVGFAAAEAASTINLATGYTGVLTLAKITNATVTVGAASTAGDITLTNTTTDLTVNATGAYSLGVNDITGNTLKNLTVAGTAAVTFDDMTSTALTTVSVTAAGALDIGDAVASLTALSSISYTATGTTGSITSDAIGSATVTSLTVSETASKAITQTTIDALDIANITIAGASGTVTVGAITAADDIVGTIALTATNGELDVATITAADEAGTISLTSTAGAIDGTASQVAVTAADGVTVNMTAATFITDTGLTGGAAILVDNNAGDITATLSGAALAKVNYTVNDGTTAGTAAYGSVNLNASSLTGGLTSTIINDELSGTGSSTVTLGAASASKVNAITFQGYTNSITATGSIGADTFIDAGTGLDGNNVNTVNSSDTFAGSTGSDTMSYAGHVATDSAAVTVTNEGTTNGMAINLSSSTVTFYAGTNTTTLVATAGTSTLAAGKAAQYDSGATGADANEKAIITGGEIDTLSGFESVIGTAKNDFIAVASTGTTVTAGAGNDVIVAGAGVDTFNQVAGDSTASSAQTIAAGASGVLAIADTLTFGNGVDVITGFTAGTGNDVLNLTNTAAAPTSALGETEDNLTEDTIFFLSGAFNTTTGAFVIAADGAGADTLIFENETTAVNDDIATVNNAIVLIGVDSADLVIGNFA